MATKPKTYLIKLIRTQVGKESKLIQGLAQTNRTALHFKVLGKYDVLEFSSLPTISDANKVNTEPEIFEITTLPCFYWRSDRGRLWDDISGSPSPCLVFLKVHEAIHHSYGIVGLLELVNQLTHGKCLNLGPIPLYPLTGLGHYEMLLWYPSDDMEKIFLLLRSLRHLTVGRVFPKLPRMVGNHGLFLDTTTLPLISYVNVIFKKKWHVLKGQVAPAIRLKAAPINELHIAQEFAISRPLRDLGMQARDTLGEDDLIFTWPQPVPLKNLIPWLFTFRKKLGDGIGLMDTTTNLMSPSPLPPPSTERAIKVSRNTESIYEQLGKLSNRAGINRHLINELICVVSLVNSSSARLASSEMVSDIIKFLLGYVSQLVDDYLACIREESYEEKTRTEGRLLHLTNMLHIALSQRFPGVETTESESGRPPLATYSVSRVVRASTSVVRYLIDLLVKSNPPQKFVTEARRQEGQPGRKSVTIENFTRPWVGFVFFDLAEGYALYDGELISMPLSNLYSPLNWVTLSHEISHAYYDRISFVDLERKFLDDFSSMIRQKKPQHLRLYQTQLEDSSWELFAQWFDYKHFYGGDFKFYLWSVWRTWLEVPRVFQHTTDYWVRSVFIKICHEWSSLNVAFNKIEALHKDDESNKAEKMELLKEQFESVAETLRTYFPGQYSRISLTNATDIELVQESLYYFYHFVYPFVTYYVNPDILNAMNDVYPRLQDHIKAIMKGRIISEEISNPFVLLRELLRRSFVDNRVKVHLSTASTVALIYSLWNCIKK